MYSKIYRAKNYAMRLRIHVLYVGGFMIYTIRCVCIFISTPRTCVGYIRRYFNIALLGYLHKQKRRRTHTLFLRPYIKMRGTQSYLIRQFWRKQRDKRSQWYVAVHVRVLYNYCPFTSRYIYATDGSHYINFTAYMEVRML